MWRLLEREVSFLLWENGCKPHKIVPYPKTTPANIREKIAMMKNLSDSYIE